MSSTKSKTKSNGNGADTANSDADLDVIRVGRLNRVHYRIPIIGTAPLIAHAWSQKAKDTMLDAMQGKKSPKEPKDPIAEFNGARYTFDDERDGFPATAFKAAIVHGARMFRGVTQVALKQTVIVIGEGPDQLVPLEYEQMVMREDSVRVGRGGTDLRYRPQYWPWKAVLNIRVVEGQIDRESLVSLVDAAGIGGVGEWRPTSPMSATGSYGTFEVDLGAVDIEEG